MHLIHKRTASVLFTIVVFALLVASIYEARRPLTAFVFAILFAYLLNPLVSRLQVCLRGSRGLAIAAAYLMFGIAITLFGITAGPRIVREAERLVRELPDLVENVGTGQIAHQFGSQRGWDYETQLQVQLFLSAHRNAITEYAQTVANRAAGLAGYLMWLLLVPILAIFLLKDHSHFANVFLGLVTGTRQRGFLKSLLHELDAMLAAFIRARLLFAALALLAHTAFLLAVRFPYAFVIGAVAGLLEFIPFVGPMVTFVLILGIAGLTGGTHWLAVLVFLTVWRVIEDYVISPYLMGRGLKLHPLAVLFGVLAGGELAGVAGLFLSVPIIAGLRIVWTAWRLQRGSPVVQDCTVTFLQSPQDEAS